MKIWQLGVTIAAVVLVALLWLLRAVDAQRPIGSDTDQIRSLIAVCDKAAMRRDAATIGRYISKDYKDGFGLRADQARAEIGRILGSAREVRANIPLNSELSTVGPDRRQADASFELHLQTVGGQSGGLTYQGTLRLRLRKEPVRYFLLFPGEEWRILAAEGYTPEFF